LALTAVNKALHEMFTLLFASKGLSFEQSAESVALFEEHFVSGDRFCSSDITCYFTLVALSRQLDHYCYLSAEPDEDLFNWPDLLEGAVAFLHRIDSYASRHFTTDRERAKSKKLRLAGAALGGLTLISAALWALIATRPISPVADDPRFKSLAGGISAEYFKGRFFDSLAHRQVDSMINLSTASPVAKGVPQDQFSSRWQGYLYFETPGRQELCLECDDGGRVYLNGRRVIDDWKLGGRRKACANVRVSRGWYALKVEHFEHSGWAAARLMSGKDRDHQSPIPASRLCCKDAPSAKVAAPPVVGGAATNAGGASPAKRPSSADAGKRASAPDAGKRASAPDAGAARQGTLPSSKQLQTPLPRLAPLRGVRPLTKVKPAAPKEPREP
jgi:hypothetical protein